jgi:hypothetical protein
MYSRPGSGTRLPANAGANQLTQHEEDPLAHPRGEELLLASASAPAAWRGAVDG